jgi:hypothetical protein
MFTFKVGRLGSHLLTAKLLTLKAPFFFFFFLFCQNEKKIIMEKKREKPIDVPIIP